MRRPSEVRALVVSDRTGQYVPGAVYAVPGSSPTYGFTVADCRAWPLTNHTPGPQFSAAWLGSAPRAIRAGIGHVPCFLQRSLLSWAQLLVPVRLV